MVNKCLPGLLACALIWLLVVSQGASSAPGQLRRGSGGTAARSRVLPPSLYDAEDTFDMNKRQFDDYGHMRFGKRGDDKFDDYGHMRFGR